MDLKYTEYLKSEDWKTKKERIRKLHNFECQICKNTKELNVHHGTYDNIFKEKDGDLFLLCKVCHSTYHDLLRGEKTTISLTNDFIIKVRTIVNRALLQTQKDYETKIVKLEQQIKDKRTKSKTKRDRMADVFNSQSNLYTANKAIENAQQVIKSRQPVTELLIDVDWNNYSTTVNNPISRTQDKKARKEKKILTHCKSCNGDLKRIFRTKTRTDKGWYPYWDKCTKCVRIYFTKGTLMKPTREVETLTP